MLHILYHCLPLRKFILEYEPCEPTKEEKEAEKEREKAEKEA